MKEGKQRAQKSDGVGSSSAFATKGRGENLLKVNARWREQERERRRERGQKEARGLREISANPFLFPVSTSCLG